MLTETNQKSLFVGPSSSQNNQTSQNNLNNSNFSRSNNIDYGNINSNENHFTNGNTGNNANNFYNNPNLNNGYLSNNPISENNPMIDRILSEVIHVSAFEQRGNLNTDIFSHPVQEMPFKIKGLLEPTKQQLSLPEGVPAPLSVLAAQPPFINDIHLISKIAMDAQMAINGYSLQVPDNVAFDFNPVA